MLESTITITLGGSGYEIARSRLGDFLALNSANAKIKKAVEAQDTGAIATGLFEYFQVVVPNLSQQIFNTFSWIEIALAYQSLFLLNQVPGYENYAILLNAEEGKRPKWHYTGREKHIWIHLIASIYHWSREEIMNLWPEDAVAYVQEILADRQNEREWQWRLSEIAYQYDPGSKKSRFVPLPIPYWISLGTAEEYEKVNTQKTPARFLPVGKIMQEGGNQIIREMIPVNGKETEED